MPRIRLDRPLAAAVLAAAACRSDQVAGPAESRLDPTAVLNSMAYSARFASAAVAGPGAPDAVAFGITTSPGASALAGFRGCAFDSGAQEFRCGPDTRGGITVTLAYAALDAAGAALAAPTAATTAAIRTRLTATGASTTTLPDGRSVTITLDQRHEATLRGFLAGPRVLDGDLTARTQISTTGGPGGATGSPPGGTLRLTQATRGLTFPGGGYPTAGTVVTAATDDAGAPLFSHVLTFDGTAAATLVVTLPGGATQRCTLDLVGAAPAPRCTTAAGGA